MTSASGGSPGAVVLRVADVRAGYGVLEILHGVSAMVCEGESVALLGPNGAGKSTLLRAIAGLIPIRQGAIDLDGENLSGLDPHQIRARGVAVVTEGMNLFLNMTVQDNLAVGASILPKKEVPQHIRTTYELFPALAARRKFLANQLSGGERKMLALGRALAGTPRVILIDEPSLGLSPAMADVVFASLGRLKQAGVSTMIIEQDASRALALADRAYVVEQGTVILEGTAEEMRGEALLREALLGRVTDRRTAGPADKRGTGDEERVTHAAVRAVSDDA